MADKPFEVCVLMYHGMYGADFPQEDIAPNDRFYALSEEAFGAQLDILDSLNGGKTRTLHELMTLQPRWPQNTRYLSVLTFDDSYASNFSIAFRLMKQHQIRGTFFITVGEIGENGRVTWDQLKEMRDYGMEIGSHSLSHPNLTSLSPEELKRELEESKRILEENLEIKVFSLGIPHGRYNSHVIDAAKKAGYKVVATSDFGLGSIIHNTFVWPRVSIRGNTSAGSFRAYVQRNRIIIRREKIRASILWLAKKILGFKAYNKLRSLLLSDKT